MSSLPPRQRVPDRYYRHSQTAAILEALEDESDLSAGQVDDLLDQFFVETAPGPCTFGRKSTGSPWMRASRWWTVGRRCGTR